MDNKRRVGDWAAEVEYYVELIHWEERIELCPVQRRHRRLHPLLPCDQWQLIARCCFKLCFELNTSEHWRHWHGMIWWWGARCSFKSSSEPNTPLYSGHKNVSVWQVTHAVVKCQTFEGRFVASKSLRVRARSRKRFGYGRRRTTQGLNNFRVRTGDSQGNQMHITNVWCQ